MFGVTGTDPFEKTESVQVSVGPNQWKEDQRITISRHSTIPKGFGDRPCDGLLGNNILQISGTVLDESGGKLYLLGQAKFFQMPAGGTTKDSQDDFRGRRSCFACREREIPADRAPVVSKTGFERLNIGMTFAQISEVLGGDLTKGSTLPDYRDAGRHPGQESHRPVFFDGKVTAKSAQGIDALQTAQNSPVGNAGIGAGRSSAVLTDFLKARGYVEVPLILNKQCIFDVEVTVNSQPLFFFLDTGSSNTDIDTDVART